jgi:hypothetical protein
MAVQARRDTILKKYNQGDDLKPGNVWVVTWEREIIQIPKDEFKKDKYKDGPFYNWGQASMYKENKTMKKLTEAAVAQIVTWWEDLPQPDKVKIANASNRPWMAKTPIQQWKDKDLEALIQYISKNNILFEIATTLKMERDNLDDKNNVKEAKQPLQDLFLYRFNDGKFSKTKVKLYSDNYLLVPPNKKPLPAEDFGDYFLSPKDMTADQAFEKWNVKEGTGSEWSSDAEAWMDQQYDQLDDKDYLIRGVTNKFKIDKPTAQRIYNKVAMTRDPITYRTGAMFEMATAQETWDRISKSGKQLFCMNNKLPEQYAQKNWNQLPPEIQEKIKAKMILSTSSPIAKYVKENVASEVKYNGDQVMKDGKKLPMYTDLKTKNTFLVKPGETLDQALQRDRAKFNVNESKIKKWVKEWMGGMLGTPNINSICDKCGEPRNACECQLEDDRKNNGKAELPKGVKYMSDDSTNMTIKKGLKESVVDMFKYKDYMIKVHKHKSSYMASTDNGNYWTSSNPDKNKVIATVKKAIDDKTIPMKENTKNYAPQNAIWFQTQDRLRGFVSRVNDKYKYEIYDMPTGTPLNKGDEPTLPLAKKAVFKYFDEHKKENETTPNAVKRDILQKIPGSKKTIKVNERLTKEAKQWLNKK